MLSVAPLPVCPDRRELARKGPRTIRYSEIARRPMEWLWPGRIAIGKLTFIVGEPGLGKGLLAVDLAARVSRGSCWPGEQEQRAPLGSVLMLHAEDDEHDTMPDRLQAAGADLEKIITFVPETEGEAARPFSLSDDLGALEAALVANPDCRMVVIDPITAYLGSAHDSSNVEVRSLLYPLAALAKRYRVAMIAIAHLNKRPSASSVNRVMGALTFVSTARTVWGVMRDPLDESQRLMLTLKNNVSEENQGLSFRLPKVEGGLAPYVNWGEKPLAMTFQSACMRSPRFSFAEQSYRDDADHVTKRLREELSSGPQPRLLLMMSVPGGEAAHYRAAERLGVLKVKTDYYGGWMWMLPEHFSIWEAERARRRYASRKRSEGNAIAIG